MIKYVQHHPGVNFIPRLIKYVDHDSRGNTLALKCSYRATVCFKSCAAKICFVLKIKSSCNIERYRIHVF